MRTTIATTTPLDSDTGARLPAAPTISFRHLVPRTTVPPACPPVLPSCSCLNLLPLACFAPGPTRITPGLSCHSDRQVQEGGSSASAVDPPSSKPQA